MTSDHDSGSKNMRAADAKNGLMPDATLKTPSQIFEDFAGKVAQAELSDINLAFQAHVDTDDDDEGSEDGSVISSSTTKDNYHIDMKTGTPINQELAVIHGNINNHPASKDNQLSLPHKNNSHGNSYGTSFSCPSLCCHPLEVTENGFSMKDPNDDRFTVTHFDNDRPGSLDMISEEELGEDGLVLNPFQSADSTKLSDMSFRVNYGLDMCETTIQDMKWMRRATWQNNPVSRLTRSTSVELTEELEDKVKFMRLSIDGDGDNPHHFVGVGDIELLDASILLAQSLGLRQKYMTMSHQEFHATTKRHLSGNYGPCRNDPTLHGKQSKSVPAQYMAYVSDDLPYNLDYGGTGYFDIYEPFNSTPPDDLNYVIKMQKGMVKVFKSEVEEQKNKMLYEVNSSLKTFVKDYNILLALAAHGPVKTFCFKRLCYLEAKFNLHVLLNEQNETAAQKVVPHRDFYNVRKVDTHIHASSCFNQKHLLRFIKKKLKKYPHEVVYQKPDNTLMTLQAVFDSLNLTAYELSTDSLDVHADKNTFHRFDKFNQKYNPLGKSMLRDIFLKTNNYIKGKYFAELVKEVASDLEESKYQMTEPRLSIYGNSRSEWHRLAEWAVSFNVVSPNIRFLIQVPRLYDVYKSKNMISNFEEILDNIFIPIVEASVNPTSNPKLHKFLNMVVGFDSVDDESKADLTLFNSESVTPDLWNGSKNPPYSYYLYYMYVNIALVNSIRKDRGLSTFSFRPHSGEAGSINHLVASFLLAENINHGLLLRKAPALQYLFYLSQIPVAMSPLSNNSLFLDYHRNPFPEFFNRGIPVSLSTDDPMQFHYTKEPLMEEYSIASQVWKMTPCDMCELASNSVRMSGFEKKVKAHWLGKDYEKEGPSGNDIRQTNLPNIRVAFRHETLCEELTMVCRIAHEARSRNHSTDA